MRLPLRPEQKAGPVSGCTALAGGCERASGVRSNNGSQPVYVGALERQLRTRFRALAVGDPWATSLYPAGSGSFAFHPQDRD
jgi:hypothetical protein